MAGQADMNDFRAAWRALAGGPEVDGWKTIPIATSAACALLAGRRRPGDQEAILVGFRKIRAIPAAQMPQGHGFEVNRLLPAPTGYDGAWVTLTRRTGGNPDLFAMMAKDLVRLLEGCGHQDDDALLVRFLSRIRAWQDFMDRHKEGVLSPEAELGLFGELVILERMLNTGMAARNVLDAWQGPLDGLQDFIPGHGGIEVKTTLSAAGFRATITSLEQLDDNLRHPLFLAAVRLGLNASGITLSGMAETIRDRLRDSQSELELFEVRLFQAGLLPTAVECYTRRFLLSCTAILPVSAYFPRLTRANLHPAIRQARYEIDLDLTGASGIDLERALELVGAI